MSRSFLPNLRSAASVSIALALAAPAPAGDWPEWRGPNRDGTSVETGLPSRWSVGGENLAWKAPYGSRSAPVVVGDRLYLHSPVGTGESVQERVLCLNADTGALVWEYRYNVFHSDVPPHRVAWASPAVDPATGNVYSFGVGAHLTALDPNGKKLWERSLIEEFGAITTHGGRTVSPIIEGDLVIVSTLTTGWGEQARGNNRYFAFDKKTGESVWVSTPQPRHYDTNYSTPIAATLDGQRMLIVGGSDGAIHALKVQTGEPVFRYEMSKRAILTSVILKGRTAFVTHSEENLDTNEMGQVAALDLGLKGEVKPDQLLWRTLGVQGGFSSPVLDGERLYEVDNGANLFAFDRETGKQLWMQNLGTIQKASPVFADGKIYVGTENGTFFILKPGPTKAEVLDQDVLGTPESPEVIIASPAIARGRVYVASMDALYAIGPKRAPAAAAATAAAKPALEPAPAGATATFVQVVPTELILKPGDRQRFRARLFDEKGRFIREEKANWTVEQLRGTIDANGELVAGEGASTGVIKASVSGLTGVARARVVPPLPWSFDFEQLAAGAPPQWPGAPGKWSGREIAPRKLLVKHADNPFTRRGRVFMGPSSLADYTVEAEVLATEKRRQLGDAGVIAQRYALVLFGNGQKLELQGWQPNTARSTSVPFAWKPDTWYRLKLRVANQQDGKTLVQGKVWPSGEAEPDRWTLEKLDAMPHRSGSPGLYADAPSEIFFDNVTVRGNQ
jgi:outer membrane protein assembly factor BamB